MGGLLSEETATPYNEIHATLQVLSGIGMTREDVTAIGKHSWLAVYITNGIHRLRRDYVLATGIGANEYVKEGEAIKESAAIEAASRLVADVDIPFGMFVDIIQHTRFHGVVRIIVRMTQEAAKSFPACPLPDRFYNILLQRVAVRAILADPWLPEKSGCFSQDEVFTMLKRLESSELRSMAGLADSSLVRELAVQVLATRPS